MQPSYQGVDICCLIISDILDDPKIYGLSDCIEEEDSNSENDDGYFGWPTRNYGPQGGWDVYHVFCQRPVLASERTNGLEAYLRTSQHDL